MRVIGLVLILLGCTKSGECDAHADCRSGFLCDTQFHTCVACLENSHCGETEFCCRGECLPKEKQKELCGCGPRLSDSPGKCEK